MAQVSEYRLWRGGRLTNRLSRLKHFRGRQIHSPFIYSVVRNVYINQGIIPVTSSVCSPIKSLGVKDKTASEITRLAHHCQLDNITIDKVAQSRNEMIICSEQLPDNEVAKLAEEASRNGMAIVILNPYNRKELCNTLIATCKSTSIDRYSYLLFLNNHLPKQHFKL